MRRAGFAWAVLIGAATAATPAAQAFEWTLDACEPPAVFYSSAHDPAVATPCCGRNPERCPGGVPCVGGTCAAPFESVSCAPAAGADAPNVVFILNDDQGYCHWGFMGPECRTERQDLTIPAPATPNLDRLVLQPESAGRGRIFEIHYANAAVSTPARESLQTGLMSKDLADPNVADRSIASVLKQPDGPIYCSFAAGGKIGGSRGEASLGYDASNRRRKWGRYNCQPAACFPACDDPPRCGPDLGPAETPDNVQDVFDFVAATLLGPRDAEGNLVPGAVYTQAQPFLLWIGSSLPHKPYAPPRAVEDRLRLEPDYLFGESALNPGTPRFPFGAAQYAGAFDRRLEKSFPGFYGNIWLADDAVRHVRAFLESVQVWDPSGTTAVSLWERTVFMTSADHGLNLPRAKGNFTENGHRVPLVIHDGRLPPSSVETRIERELTHAVDVLPTIAEFAGHTPPPGPGRSLRAYLSSTPPATPLRDLMCGHRVKGRRTRGDRFIRTRPGVVGRCAPPAGGTSCSTNAECGQGVCLLGTCASGTRCLEDDDCAGAETCQHKTQKWCRFGRNPLTEAATIPPVDQQPVVACTTDADCTAACPAADPLYCTCEYQELRFYVLLTGEARLMDLFVDPDEPGMSNKLRKSGPLPGDLDVGPGAPHEHLGSRLRCCLDHWWIPATKNGPIGDPSCTRCEPRYECRRCGDGIVDAVEECDGANLNGATCATVGGGFGGGTLACSSGCTFDTSGCVP